MKSEKRPVRFTDAVEMVRQRVEASGRQIVIRDWSHLDFTGVPFLEQPSYRLTTAEALHRHYNLIQAVTVRHPVDQWISLTGLVMFRFSTHPRIGKILHGYLRFAEYAAKIGYVRYEDFTQDSDAMLEILCERLGLAFDGGYKKR